MCKGNPLAIVTLSPCKQALRYASNNGSQLFLILGPLNTTRVRLETNYMLLQTDNQGLC